TDITHAERQAHTIKGASANVGGMILSELARTMEKSVSLGDLCAAKAKLPELESQFERLQEAMQAIYG
ncbi:Hpt domain-containing protein, partial [bacterium]|nr:Hpt domain-containing protein [bacterium]